MKTKSGFNREKITFFFVLLWFYGPGISSAVSTEEWLRRTGNVVSETTRGNPQGALYQALPAVHTNLPSRTSVYAHPGGAGLRQPLPVSWKSPLGGAGAAYNAGTSYGLKQPPKIYQNVQVAASNRYLSNTTTFVPPSRSDQ